MWFVRALLRAARTAGVVLAFGGLPGAALRGVVDETGTMRAFPTRATSLVGSGRVLVTVRDGPGGPPFAGAQVRAFVMIDDGAYLVSERQTDVLGRAPLAKLPRGETWIVADAPGRARGSTHVVVDQEPRMLLIDLAPEHAFDVLVNDEEGTLIAGAEVEVVADADPLPVGARSGEDGRAHVARLSDGPWRVTARAAGYEEGSARVDKGDRMSTLVLRRLGSFAVRVSGVGDRAVSGALVVVAGAMLWPPRSAETDARGDVRIGGLAAGVYAFRASRGDLVSPIELGVSLGRGEDKAIVLRLRPGRWVAVHVTDGDGDDAEGIGMARVNLAEGGLSPFPIEATTDSKGRARLGPIASGVATLSARADGFVTHGAISLPDPPPRETRLVLVRAGVLSGRVVDERGFPIDGARVEIVGNDASGAPIFDDPRRASFQAAQFDAMLAGPMPLVSVGELGVTPGPVPPIPASPAFERASSLPGLGPVSGIRSIEPWVTRSDGTFRAAPASPGQVRAIVHHPRYVDAESEVVTLASGREARVAVVMHQGGSLEGRVVDARDRPVAGARILASGVRVGLERSTRTARDGTFALAALPEEVSVTTSTDDDEQPDARVSLRIPHAGRTEVTIRLSEPRGALAVTVVGDGDWPIDGAQVSAISLASETPLRTTAFTDAHGEAALRRARGLPLRIEVNAPGRAPRVVTTDGGPEALRIELTPAERATGEVGAAVGGEGVAGAEVTLSTNIGVHRVYTDARGAYTLTELTPGEATLRARARGFAAVSRAVAILDSSGRHPLVLPRIELPPEGVVEGEVVDSRGERVPGARVATDHAPTWLAAGTSSDLVAVADAQGRFSLHELAEGTAVLEAYAPDLGRGRIEGVRVVAGRTTSGARIVIAGAGRDDERSLSAAGGVAVTLGEAVPETGAPVQVVVVSVAPGSEAERAGLAPGDVLLAVDDAPVRTMNEARDRLSGALPDDVVLRLVRRDHELVLRVSRESVRR